MASRLLGGEITVNRKSALKFLVRYLLFHLSLAMEISISFML